jgi:hypothetical protein
MRRRILIALLAFGTIGGFAAGCASLAHHRHQGYGGWGYRGGYDEHVSELCTEAALRVYRSQEPRR